jgi:hypothetical protein
MNVLRKERQGRSYSETECTYEWAISYEVSGGIEKL